MSTLCRHLRPYEASLRSQKTFKNVLSQHEEGSFGADTFFWDVLGLEPHGGKMDQTSAMHLAFYPK